jgi:glycogen operon protein
VRGFVKSDDGLVHAMAARLAGSPDVYGQDNREPEQSINFITVHDGFTLNDLVSYNQKHNEANGHDNLDGSDENRSWNCGIEGPTDDAAVEALRNRQVKNLLALLLNAAGAPLLLMGDEVRRTQQGNNNAYCQDNETSWFDWALVTKHADIHRFVKLLIAARVHRQTGRTDEDTLQELLSQADVTFHGAMLGEPDEGASSHSLAVSFASLDGRVRMYLATNAYWEPLDFELPPPPAAGQGWRRWLDTSLPSPEDIHPWVDAPPVSGSAYRVGPRSVVGLVATLLD